MPRSTPCFQCIGNDIFETGSEDDLSDLIDSDNDYMPPASESGSDCNILNIDEECIVALGLT